MTFTAFLYIKSLNFFFLFPESKINSHGKLSDPIFISDQKCKNNSKITILALLTTYVFFT